MSSAALAWRFAALPALATLALTAALIAVGGAPLRGALTRHALAEQQQRAELLALRLQSVLQQGAAQAALDRVVERPPRAFWAGLVAPDGRVLAVSGDGLAGRAVPDGLPADLDGPRLWQDAQGRPWLLAQAKLGDGPQPPWRVAVLQDADAALAPCRELLPWLLATGIAAAALAGAAGWWLSRRLRGRDAGPPEAAVGATDYAALARRLLEQERLTSRQLAHTLHDELGQTLAALRLHWEAGSGAAAGGDDGLHERVTGLVVQANRQVRALLAELSPPLLEELGLAAALDNEIRQHRGGEGEADVELLVSPAAEWARWPAAVEYAAFMVAREALHNALRHAGARSICVRLDADAGALSLAVEDDGRGLEPSANRLGLVGMRERALAVGARLNIDGRPGHGTMIELTWLPAEQDADDEPHLPD